MHRFTATTESEAIVPADRTAIWTALTDPDLLPRLTPLLDHIDADGDVWTWHMRRIAALGVSITPSFPERMHFDEGRRIEFAPEGGPERTGAQGWYDLDDGDGGTHLRINLTLTIDLPLPGRATPVVTRVMKATMNRTGDRFSENLLRYLGLDENAAA